MSMKVAGIDLPNQALDNEYRIGILERIIDKIIKKEPGILTSQNMAEIRTDVIKAIQNKYPEATIKATGTKDV